MDRLTSIRVFCAVVETGSFAAAAEREKLSPAMTSRHLMHLETNLRARLLNRTTRQLSLTEAGGIYYNRCRAALDDLDDAELTVANLTGSAAGVLRLVVPAWFAGPCFGGTVIAFHRHFPAVTLDVNFTDRPVNIVEEGYDLALRVTFEPPQGLIARRVGPMPYLLMASPDYLGHHGTPTRPEDLANHAFIACSSLGITMPEVLDFSGPDGARTVRLAPALHLNNPTVAMQAAETGVGVTVIPAFIAHERLADGRLVPVLPGHSLPQPDMYALYASRQHLSPKVRSFIDFFVRRYNGQDEPRPPAPPVSRAGIPAVRLASSPHRIGLAMDRP